MSALRSTGSGSETDHSIPGLQYLCSDCSSDDDGADDGPSRAARYGSEALVLTPYLVGRLVRYGGTKAGSGCISFAGNRRPL